jgi:ribonuclease D
LNEEQHKKFEAYKEIRKELAKNAAIPPYAIFNDYELAEIAKIEAPNEKNIIEIKGISKNKAEKYGKVLLEKYALVSAPLNDRVGADMANIENTNMLVGAGFKPAQELSEATRAGLKPAPTTIRDTQQELFQ